MQTPVDGVVSFGDSGSFLILHIYSKQATVSAAVSFLRNKGIALLSQLELTIALAGALLQSIKWYWKPAC